MLAHTSDDSKQQNARKVAKELCQTELQWMIDTFRSQSQKMKHESQKARDLKASQKADQLQKKYEAYDQKATIYHKQYLKRFK